MKKMEFDQRRLLPKSLKVVSTRKTGDVCTQCKSFCFFSKVACEKHPALVACLRHHVGKVILFNKMCECEIKQKSLAVYVNDEEFDFYIEKMNRSHQISQIDGTDDDREWERESPQSMEPMLIEVKTGSQTSDVKYADYQPSISYQPGPPGGYKPTRQFKPINSEYQPTAKPEPSMVQKPKKKVRVKFLIYKRR